MDKLESMSKEELIELLKKTLDDNKLKDETIAKKDQIISKQEVKIRGLNLQIEQLIAKYEDKLEASRLHLVEQYIPKSEKLKDEDLVINELEVIRHKKKRKSPTESFIKDLKDIDRGEDIIIDYNFDGIDTSHIKPFGQDETYKLEYKPACFEVHKVIKKKYKDKDKIYEATYDDPFPHSPLTPSLASNLIEMKYNLGVPFYRYSAYLKAHGLNISDIDIYNYAYRTMELLEPLYKKLLEELLQNKHSIIHADETSLKVINSDKEKCYMFVYTTSFWDNAIYIYDFVDGRSTNKTKELLKDFKGYIVCDAYAGYDSLTKQGTKLQRCMIHSRRRFNDVLKVLDESSIKKSPAYKVIELMSKLFKYESDFRKNKLTANDIYYKRHSDNYIKAIDDLNAYIDSIDYSNNELLADAVKYYLNHSQELYTYLENGYLEMSNNLAERVVKPFVIARKNFLFCKTADGAITTGKLFSIVQTAKANGLKSEQYLTYVISNINKKDINELLPWSTSLPKDLLISNY